MILYYTAFIKWKQGLLQDENHVLFMTKCLGEEHCDVSKLVHNSQEEYATFFKTFSKAVIPDRKLKNMIRCYNEFPFELNFTVHDEALLMITLENNLKKWKFELEVKLAKNPDHPSTITECKLTSPEKKCLPLSRYTMGSDTGGNLRTGWNVAGVKRFTFFLDKCKLFRQRNDYHDITVFTIDNYEPVKKRPAKRSKQQHNAKEVDTTKELEKIYQQYMQQTEFHAV